MQDKMIKMLMGKKKQGKPLSDSEKKSKLQALQGMKSMAHKMMSDKLQNLKKVTVASDSKPGLQEGLHKAEDMIDKSPEDETDPEKMWQGGSYSEGGNVAKMPKEFDTDMDHVEKEHNYDEQPRSFNEGGEAEESPEHESSESPEMEAGENEESLEKIMEDSPNDPNELDELIKKLEEKKRNLSK